MYKVVRISSIVFFVVLSVFKVYTQGVGINSTGAMPDPSGMLDIVSDSSGVLLPRVSLNDTADQSTIASPTTSLIVYNSNAAMTGGNGVGLYQWSGSKWVNLVAPTNGPGTDGQVLTSKGAGSAPVWKTGSYSGASCSVSKRIFVSSGLFNGNLGGIIGADSICQAYADTQSLGGTWKALLSGDNTSDWAVNRLTFDWDILRDLWGRPITSADRMWGGHYVNGSNQLISLSNSLTVNEKGDVIASPQQAWGAPKGGGDPGVNDCNNWTSTSSGDRGTYIQQGAMDRSYFGGGGGTPCHVQNRLVCIEQ